MRRFWGENREELVIPSGEAFAGEKPSDGGKRVSKEKTEADAIRSWFGFCCMLPRDSGMAAGASGANEGLARVTKF